MGSPAFWFWVFIAVLNGWYVKGEFVAEETSVFWVIANGLAVLLSLHWANQAWAKWENRKINE